MAYTAVKLADVQKAISAVTAANKKYTDALANSKTTETALTNAQKALDAARTKLESLQSAFDDQSYLPKNPTYANASRTLAAAEKKLDDLRSYLDSGQYLEKNKAYQDALKKITAAEKNRDIAQSKLDAATDKNRAALEKAFNTANKVVDTAQAGAEKARAAAEKLAQNNIANAEKSFNTATTGVENARVAAEKAYLQGTIKPAQTALDKATEAFDTAQGKHQTVLDSYQPYIDERNEAINNVRNYVTNIRDSLGDVTTNADANAVKTMLGQIQTAVNGTKLDDLINAVTPEIKSIDPLEMANIPTVNIPKGNPDYFPNVDPNTKLPILDQGALDGILNKLGTNTLNKDQYRDNYNKFGWNVKSDGSSVARGAAIFGLEKSVSPMGGGISYTGDFNKAAKEANVDISGLKTNEEKYNAINEATKDFYVVANALDRTGASANQKAPHAAILFKADGSGNLVPVVKSDGEVAATYFDAVGVSHAGWRGQLAELAPVISIASMAFLPGIGQALGQSIAGTTAGAALGAAGSQAVANAAIGAGMAALTGGDPLKAAVLAGAGTMVSANAGKVTESLGISNDAISKIAEAAKISTDQAKNIIANGVSTAIASGVTGSDDLLRDVVSNVAGNFADAKAVNAVVENLGTMDPKALASAASIAGSVANVAGNAIAGGGDLTQALNAAMPGILSNAVTAGTNIVSTTTGASGFPLQSIDQDQYQQQLIAAGFTPGEAEEYASALFGPGGKGIKVGDLMAAADIDGGSLKVDISGVPILKENEFDLKTDLPPGFRLATYDETVAYDLTAIGLPNGQSAFVLKEDGDVPDFSSITGQAGAGALGSSFGAGTGGAEGTGPSVGGTDSWVPGKWSGSYLPYIVGKPTAGGIGAPVKVVIPEKSLPPVEVIGTPDDKTLPPVEVIGTPDEEEIIDDTTKASQEFPLTPQEEEAEAVDTSLTSPRQQMLNMYGILSAEAQPQQKTTAKWFDRFLGSTTPTPGYQSIFDPTEYELLDFDVDQVDFLEPVTEPQQVTPEVTAPTSPLTQAATLSSNPQAYTMQGVTSMPSNYYQYGDLNPLNLSSSFITPQAGTPYARGGLASMRPTAALFAAHGGEVPHKGSHYVQGAGGGQDDLIEARLADGEYVFDADIVAALGDGSNAEGARRLDKMREAIRKHKRSAPNDKIPPKAKSPLAYFKGAK